MLKHKVISMVFLILSLLFFNSFIEKESRDKLYVIRDVTVLNYYCKSQKHNSFMHRIVIRGGGELYNLTTEECMHHELESVVKQNLLIDLTTDGKEFYEIISESEVIFQIKQKKELLEKRRQASLLLAAVFFGLASLTY